MADDNKAVFRGWITIKEAMALAGYDDEYLRSLARQGRISAIKIDREWLISRDALLAYKARMDALGKKKFAPRRRRKSAPAPAGADTSPTSVGESEEKGE